MTLSVHEEEEPSAEHKWHSKRSKQPSRIKASCIKTVSELRSSSIMTPFKQTCLTSVNSEEYWCFSLTQPA